MSGAAEGRKPGGQRNESILELQKMMDAMVLVKCLGGRELKGILRGFDDLVNLVIDESEEFVRGMLPDHQRLQYLYP
jgi:small nuclear ribonucleoprotein (snRNP)-like protein